MKILSPLTTAALFAAVTACSPQHSNFEKKVSGEASSPDFIPPQDESIRVGFAYRYSGDRNYGPRSPSQQY